MIKLYCPGCGQPLEFLDEKRDFGFCQYCGTKILFHESKEHEHAGLSSVRSLCEKGFQEIDAKDYLSASISFDRAAEVDCNDTEVLIGKSLVKIKKGEVHSGFNYQTDEYAVFDEFYFKQLQKRNRDISVEEKKRINEINCSLFLKLYCFMWDAARAEYVINHFPNSICMDLISHEHFSDLPARTRIMHYHDEQYWNNIVKLLDERNPVNVIQLLLSNGIKAETVFMYLYYQAYEQGEFSSKFDTFHSDKLPERIIMLLEKNGPIGSLSVPVSVSYTDKDMYTLRRDGNAPFYTIAKYAKMLGGEEYKTVFYPYQREEWKKYNRCQYCGSYFKGLFQKVCSNPSCRKKKDY